MKNLSLGKSLITILILFITILNGATVETKVDKKEIYKGDIINYTIIAYGDKIEFPKIRDINSSAILNTSTGMQTVIINNKVTKSLIKTYTISPEHNLTIPSYEVKVDGKVYKTKPIDIKVVQPSKSAGGARYLLELKANKKVVRVGEPIKLSIIFKQRRDIKIDRLNIIPPNLNGFWVKDLGDFTQGIDGNYITQTKSYLIFPQKDGNFTIPSIVAQVGKIKKTSNNLFDDPFFSAFNSSIEWSRIASNSLNIEVIPLPQGVTVSGNFNIQAKVDKTKVYANKPVNLTIKIEGSGNIDDIEKFNINLPDAIIYADDPKINSYIKNGKYYGTFTQKIAIIADRNYTIPSIEFKFFDGKEVKIIKTKPIKIEVIGGNSSNDNIKVVASNIDKNTTKTKIVYKKSNSWLSLIIGFILGIFTTLIFTKFKFKPQKEELPITKAIKKAKNDKELYNLLLPYLNEGEFIKEVINKLEENIYKKTQHKINKQDIIDYLEEINLA